ncbi:MAG: POTRA domain-containing protein [Acidobacteriota bacterium]
MRAGTPRFSRRRLGAPPAASRTLVCPRFWGALTLGFLAWAGSPTSATQAPEGWPPDIQAAENQEGETADPRVETIEVRCDGPLGVDIEALLAFGVGDPLDEAAVRRTLSNIHATGLVSEAALLRRPGSEPGAVVTVLVLRRQIRVRAVRFEGEPGLRPGRLEREVLQKEGAALDEGRILASIGGLRDLYRRRGYFEADVRTEIRPNERGPLWRDLVFVLRGGPRARLGEVGVEGPGLAGMPQEDSPAKLVEAMRSRLGRNYDPDDLDDDRRRLRRFLTERGYLAAEVGAPAERYDAEDGVVSLVFPVDTGPKMVVEVTGFELKRLRRRGLLPFLEEEPFDPLALDQACGNLETFLQRRGHYRAQVGCRYDPSAVPHRVTIEVDVGPELELSSIHFEGNRQISEGELRRLLTTGPSGALSKGRLVSRDLAADLENLRSFYLLQGFSQVRVGPASIEQDGELLTLTVPIEEGPRSRLVGFSLSGVEHFDPEVLRAKLPLRPGGPYHPLLLDDSVQVLRTLYAEAGFASTRVTRSLDWGEDGLLVDVDLQVEEGPQTRIDRVILRGQVRTRRGAVLRAAGVDEGDILSRAKLLQAERDLYRLGVFSKVDVDAGPAGAVPERRDIVIRLEESLRWSLSYGLSYHSDDGVGGLLGLVRSNLAGRGAKLQLDLRASANDRRGRLIYDEPSLWGLPLPFTSTLFLRDEDRESYSVREGGSQLTLTHDRTPVRWELTYGYRRVELEETVADPSTVEREDREVEISSLTPLLFVERRDDPLDPSAGWSTALQLEWAFPAFEADTHFLKLFWQQTRYLDLGALGTLAGSLRLGAIEPLGDEPILDPLLPPELASAGVPVSERFFAGGRTTHRAYERDRLGILGQSLVELGDGRLVEAGGNGLALLNVDWRFPLQGAVGGVVFFDLGNVWADWRRMDASDLRPGAGFGARYASPIGPVRVEVGWKLDPQDFEDEAPVFFLSFGNPF